MKIPDAVFTMVEMPSAAYLHDHRGLGSPIAGRLWTAILPTFEQSLHRLGEGALHSLHAIWSARFSHDACVRLIDVAIALSLLVACCVSSVSGAKPRLSFVMGHPEMVSNETVHDGACVVSHSGRFLYATRAEKDAYLFFSRSPASGEVMCRCGGGDGEPTALALSHDGRYLYIVGNWPNAIMENRLAPSGGFGTARMVPLAVGPEDPARNLPALRRARGVAISPDDKSLYVTSVADHSLLVFSRDIQTGRIVPLQLFQDNATGAIAAEGEEPEVKRVRGATIVDGLKGTRGVTVSLDGRFVYVAGAGEDAMAIFRREPEKGRLQFVAAVKNDRAGQSLGFAAPHHMVISPDDRYLYVACAGDTVAVCRRDAETGELTSVQTLRNGEGGVDGIEYPRQVAMDRKGKMVFVAASGRRPGQSALTVFTRDPTTGKLTQVQILKDADYPRYGLTGISSVCVSPDGRHVYTTSLKYSVGVFVVRRQ